MGHEVLLRVFSPCPRCVMTTLPQGDLPQDHGILRAAAEHNNANVGVYAMVVQPGLVRRGDAVRGVEYPTPSRTTCAPPPCRLPGARSRNHQRAWAPPAASGAAA